MESIPTKSKYMYIICIISDFFVLLILFTITLKDFSKRLLSHFPRASLDFHLTNTTFTNFLCHRAIVLNSKIITAAFHHSAVALLLTSTLPAKWVQSLVGGSVGSPDNMYQANKNTDIYKYLFVDCTNTIPDIYK